MKVIKRSIRRGQLNKHHKKRLDNIIYKFNLFVLNIFNFNKLYHCSGNTLLMSSIDDLDTIYDILRSGDKYKCTDNNFSKAAFKFFKEIYANLYFNPNGNDCNYLIDDTYLSQVYAMNRNCIFSTITNNITFRYDQYLRRYIMAYINVQFDNILKYNSLIKKCSLYEKYINENKDIKHDILNPLQINSNMIKELINILEIEKIMFGKYNIKTLSTLASNLSGKLTNHAVYRSNNNIFNDELTNIKQFEKKIDNDKTLIKKIIIGECEESEKVKLEEKCKSIFNNIDTIYPNIPEEYLAALGKQPFAFLGGIININNYLVKNGFKSFKVFPTYNDPKPRHIMLDSACIDNIFLGQKYHNTIIIDREKIWKEVFKFPQNFFKMNNKYVFEGTIQTDGISMSMIYHSFEDDDNAKNIAKLKLEARKQDTLLKERIFDNVCIQYEENINYYETELNELYLSAKTYEDQKKKYLKCDDYDDIIIKIYKMRTNYNDLIKFINEKCEYHFRYEKESEKLEKEDKKQKYEKQKVENQKKYKENLEYLKNNKNDEYRIIIRKNKECYYLDDLTDAELEEVKKEKKIYMDLGKHQLTYSLNDTNGKFSSYSSKERQVALKTKQYTYNIETLNKNLHISEVNEKLKDINRRLTNKDKVIEDQKTINKEYENKYEKYLSMRFRKEKLQKYMTKQQSESLMIKKLMGQLGIKDLEELKTYILIVGDWGGSNNLKNSKPTLGIGMRRLLKKYFKKMYLIDETRTSLNSNITHEPTRNPILEILCYTNKEKTKSTVISKRIHGILSFKMEKSIVCKKNHNDLLEETVDVLEKGKMVKKILVTRFIKRDKNAVLNFKYLTEYYLNNNRERQEAFKRHPKTLLLKKTKEIVLKSKIKEKQEKSKDLEHKNPIHINRK